MVGRGEMCTKIRGVDESRSNEDVEEGGIGSLEAVDLRGRMSWALEEASFIGVEPWAGI